MPSVTEILDTMDYGPAPEANGHVARLAERLMPRASAISSTAPSPSRRWRSSTSSNPANGEKLARVAQGSAADVDAAVKAARKAFGPWSKLPGHERAKHLYAIARIIQKRERFLSRAGDDGQWQAHPRVAATSTFRWWRGTSIITPAGRS